METVNMSKKKYNELMMLDLDPSIIHSEADFYIALLRNKPKVFKSLYINDGPSFGAKLYIIELLNTFRELLPSSFVLPDSLCSVQGKIVGFSMDIIDGTPLELILNNPKVDLEIKKHYLKEVGRLLEQLDKIRKNTELDSIFINDLNPSNFLIEKDTNELRTIDLDSCMIGDSKPFYSRLLGRKSLINRAECDNKYIKYNSKEEEFDELGKYDFKSRFGIFVPDANTDAYCYNMMILNFLYGGNVNLMTVNEYCDYLFYLSKIGIDHDLTESFFKLVNTCDNNVPIESIDSLTYEQIAKARRRTYNTVKGK